MRPVPASEQGLSSTFLIGEWRGYKCRTAAPQYPTALLRSR